MQMLVFCSQRFEVNLRTSSAEMYCFHGYVASAALRIHCRGSNYCVLQTKKKSPFGFFFREPLAEAPLHGLPARPAAIVDGGDDLEGPQPLDEALYLQIAAVFTVGDSCQETKEGFL